MNKKFHITRKIEIDAGHRVTMHDSKCKNVHGHRYVIYGTFEGPLFVDGAEQGMVADFGHLKSIMMGIADAYCDHAMILGVDDPYVEDFISNNSLGEVKTVVAENGFYFDNSARFGKLYVIPYVPTSENLAYHWYNRMSEAIASRYGDRVTLVKIKVEETPNCYSEYPCE